MKFLIDGLPPHEYAGLWGSTDHDGAYFYNYGNGNTHTSKWLQEFVCVIERQIIHVKEIGEGNGDRQFDKGSIKGLTKLLSFVKQHQKRQLMNEEVTRACGVPV